MIRTRKKLRTAGFTLVEILLVVAIISLSSSVSFAVGRSYLLRARHLAAVQVIESQLVSARVFSTANRAGSSWGVRSANSSVTLFSGESYDTRNVQLDYVTQLPSLVTVTGNDIVFQKDTGFVSGGGVYTISSEYETTVVQVNTLGVVE